MHDFLDTVEELAFARRQLSGYEALAKVDPKWKRKADQCRDIVAGLQEKVDRCLS